MVARRVALQGAPRRFTSPREVTGAVIGLWVRAPTLWSAYLGGLDRAVRERVMVAVSRANACSACTRVHERWALWSGATDEELNAIGPGELARLDDRSRAAVVYATALAESRFHGSPDSELVELVSGHLTPYELRAVEAVARAMAFANLSANTMRPCAATRS